MRLYLNCFFFLFNFIFIVFLGVELQPTMHKNPRARRKSNLIIKRELRKVAIVFFFFLNGSHCWGNYDMIKMKSLNYMTSLIYEDNLGYMLVYKSWYVSFRSSFLLDLLYIICMFNIKIFVFIEKIYNFTYRPASLYNIIEREFLTFEVQYFNPRTISLRIKIYT